MSWTFLSNHGHIAVQLARDPDIRLTELAARVGVTERRVRAIIQDLVESGYVVIIKSGRRNSYQVQTTMPLRHEAESNRTLGELLGIFDSSHK